MLYETLASGKEEIYASKKDTVEYITEVMNTDPGFLGPYLHKSTGVGRSKAAQRQRQLETIDFNIKQLRERRDGNTGTLSTSSTWDGLLLGAGPPNPGQRVPCDKEEKRNPCNHSGILKRKYAANTQFVTKVLNKILSTSCMRMMCTRVHWSHHPSLHVSIVYHTKIRKCHHFFAFSTTEAIPSHPVQQASQRGQEERSMEAANPVFPSKLVRPPPPQAQAGVRQQDRRLQG